MNTAKKSITRELFSIFLPQNSIALKINPDKNAGTRRYNYSMLHAKFFTFCFLGMVLFSACKKELDVLPSPSTTNLNDTLLKAGAPTFYIAPSGSDAMGNGTLARPWASLYKASQMVTTSGSIIRLAAGTYTEPRVCSIAVGVSIVGEGATTIIKGTYRTTGSINQTGATILLNSPNPGTNGNQSLSYFTLDGNALAGSRAITVRNRGQVLIHHMTIKDFFLGGVVFYNSGAWYESAPKAYEVGNQLYNCTIDNCGDTDATWNGGGLIMIACQQDLLIHDNLLYSNKRVGAHSGNIINAGGRHFKGVKYYNNQSWKPDQVVGWNFHLEIWGNQGGFEIYNNTFTGGGCAVDMAGKFSNKGTYPYSFSIHDNLFKQNNPATIITEGEVLIMEADNISTTLIYNNTFNNGFRAIRVYPFIGGDVKIYDNTFNQALYALYIHYSDQGTRNTGPNVIGDISFYRNKIYIKHGTGHYYGTLRINATSGITIQNINIYNNTLVTDNSLHMPGFEVSVGSGSYLKNVNVKNNIFCYFTNGSTFKIANGGTIAGLHIDNNLSYNLANYRVLPLLTGNAISNYSYVNNIPKSNTTQLSPRFVNEAAQNFNLQAGSPAINAGALVGLAYKGSAPDISAIEY